MIRQTVMFSARNVEPANGLWVTNGTAAGTYELTGYSGAPSSGLSPTDFTDFNGEVFFVAGDASNHVGLWLTNGTGAGTGELVSNASPTLGLSPYDLTALISNSPLQASKLVFGGQNINVSGGAAGLWVSDGTAAGTQELTGISGASTSGFGFDPQYLTPYHPRLITTEVLFAGNDASGGNGLPNGLWATNGTVAGTNEVGGLDSTGISGANSSGIAPAYLTVFNGEVLFSGVDTGGFRGLWVTNGTATGTQEIASISGTGATGLFPNDFTVFNGEALFNGFDASGNTGLWLTNGTSAGTSELTGISGANSAGVNPKDMTVFNGEVLFDGENTSGNFGLWVTDGTAANTHEITGINGAPSSGLFGNTSVLFGQGINPYFTVFAGEVLFSGFNASGKIGLWVTDGTAGGTHELTDINGAYQGTGGFEPTSLAAVTLLVPPPDNFNRNNTSDVLFRNDSSGAWGWSDVNNNLAWHDLGGSSTAYGVVGTGDFNGDGAADVLWRDDASGAWGWSDVNNNLAWHDLGGS
jgi:ELWxxDGT repeat protein